MLSFFQQKRELTRAEKNTLLTQVVEKVAELRTKESELKKDAQSYGESSIHYRKLISVTMLLKKIDKHLSAFNTAKCTEHTDEEQETHALVKKLLRSILKVLSTEEEILKTPRNNNRENLSSTVYWGTYAATFIASTPFGIVGQIVGLAVGNTSATSAQEATGLNDTSPSSIRIVNGLVEALKDINQSLNMKTSMIDVDECKESEHDELRCPLTDKVMKDPVLCTLDKTTYEREAITEWLKISRTTPRGREIILGKKEIKEVLIPNKFAHHVINVHELECPEKEPAKSPSS